MCYLKFLHFHSFLKNQFQTNIKSLQCNNGGEYDNHQFPQLFPQNDIQMCFSCPYTSQQNGKLECMFCTINNVIRLLLFRTPIPPTYWVQALHMASHLLNILLTTTVLNDTPFLKLFLKQPLYSHLLALVFYAFLTLSHPISYPRAPLRMSSLGT